MVALSEAPAVQNSFSPQPKGSSVEIARVKAGAWSAVFLLIVGRAERKACRCAEREHLRHPDRPGYPLGRWRLEARRFLRVRIDRGLAAQAGADAAIDHLIVLDDAGYLLAVHLLDRLGSALDEVGDAVPSSSAVRSVSGVLGRPINSIRSAVFDMLALSEPLRLTSNAASRWVTSAPAA